VRGEGSGPISSRADSTPFGRNSIFAASSGHQPKSLARMSWLTVRTFRLSLNASRSAARWTREETALVTCCRAGRDDGLARRETSQSGDNAWHGPVRVKQVYLSRRGDALSQHCPEERRNEQGR